MSVQEDVLGTEPERWVDDHGDYLYRYALVRLRDPSRAEDAVQETFLAAWKSRDSFRQDASVRTWLTGILKHKIVDQMRGRAQQDALRAGTDSLDDLFDRRGLAKAPARAWHGDPAKDFERSEFWACFHSCLSKLPQKLADAFVLREIDGLASDEICKDLGITSTNYWVILHRARLKLRECLEENWFRGSRRGHD